MIKIIHSDEITENLFTFRDSEKIPIVQQILIDIKNNGDKAVKKYTERFDRVILADFKVDNNEIETALNNTDNQIIHGLEYAAKNIRCFAQKQLECFKDFEFEIETGVFSGQKIVSIERAGIYVPGGRFPLISTLLMCAIPAQVAGVKEIAVFSPPANNGSINPYILTAAKIIGINEIYKIGGVQAIAAMAYGTETIKKVDKIVGPGNKYVAIAKKEVYGIVGIDFIAGPTEILIIADEYANPELLAADILAQAEHDIDAQPTLITNSLQIAEKVNKEIQAQIEKLKTKDTASESIKRNGIIIIVKNIEDAVNIANRKAPEHLELQIRNPEQIKDKLKNYGTLFIGEYAAEVLGDYSSGLNHTLPTNATARYTGGLGVKDFIKIQTTLRSNSEGLNKIGPPAKLIAELEGLDGHAKSVGIRLRRN